MTEKIPCTFCGKKVSTYPLTLVMQYVSSKMKTYHFFKAHIVPKSNYPGEKVVCIRSNQPINL
jgi:hypothetical protein